MRLFQSVGSIQFWHLAWLAAVIPVQAQVNAPIYPVREIRSICQSAPGSGADILIRHYSEQLSKRLGKPVVVENMPGAQGKIATSAAARAKPDGYTILITPASASLAASKHIVSSLRHHAALASWPQRRREPGRLVGAAATRGSRRGAATGRPRAAATRSPSRRPRRRAPRRPRPRAGRRERTRVAWRA